MLTTPEQVQRWLDGNLHRMDNPAQWLGTEPNARRKPWDESAVRWLLAASWPYFHSAGNQSVPAVYQSVNDHPGSLADLSYLPETPRDLRMLERGGVPVFGIESKHPLADFDVVGTSISYSVLFMNYCKLLQMSGIPLRWRDREAQGLENFPMVVIGGQAFCAPGAMEPVADCIWLGEVEDEPGNGGIGLVCSRIEQFKQGGRWQADRLGCYQDLAREFNYLFFPRFTEVLYGYRDFGLAHPTKAVTGYRSLLEGQRMPFRSRRVKDMDKIEPLRSAPLLYSDPSMGAGDLEVARGCPAWCSFCRLCLGRETEFLTRYGVRQLADCAGESHEVWTSRGWVKADIAQHGEDTLNTITFAPAFRGWSHYAQRFLWKKTRGDFAVTHRATSAHRWPLADGGETHDLKPGDFVSAEFVSPQVSEEHRRGWAHGMVFGDGTLENSHLSDRSNCYSVLVRADKPEHLAAFSRLECSHTRQHSGCGRPVCVVSVTRVSGHLFRLRLNSRVKLKRFPASDASADYVRGFIEGWDAADGFARTRSADRLRIRSQRPDAEHWLRTYAAFGGWVLTGACERSMDTNFARRSNVPREFMLSRVTAWKVVSIERGEHPEPVYCATVPGVGFWTLSTGVYTGNTYVQKPYRQRSVGESVRHARVWTQNMGSVELSPFSPDFPMHTQKKRLLTELLTGVLDEVDTTAMRVDDFIADNEYVMVQAIGGADAVTLGLEGNSQRMRDLVGKGTSDADVEEAVYRGIRAGFRKFKLFMIVSLPGEDEGDVYRIVRLAKRLAAIRDELGQPNVRFQFSWTPLLIEAKTPFQWFAPTPPDHTLIDVADLFRQLKVDFKIGTKAEPNKVAFFQLAQRASREVGEAIVDVLEELSAACWGGVPRDMRDRLEAALQARGFANGFADCFGVRDFGDLFGHEYIDTGVSERLLWDTYRQMVEFLQGTDSRTYDDAVADARVHGQEWIARCDRTCLGKTCGACDPADLKLRSRYIAAAGGEARVHLPSLRPIDLTSQACKIRVRLDRPAELRWVGNAHWRYSLRRAAYQAAEAKQAVLPAGTAIAKRSIRFASDGIAYRDWCAGTDYAEFALTRDVNWSEATAFLREMALRLAPWLKLGSPDPRWPLADLRHAPLVGWELLPPSATLGTGASGYYELELAEDPGAVEARLAAWEQASYVKLVLHGDASYFGVARTEVNAKDLVSGIWTVREGHRLKLRMLIAGKAGPYQVYAALMGKPGWLDAAGQVARRLEWFFPELPSFPVCLSCGSGVPQPLIEEQSEQFCPRCSTSLTSGLQPEEEAEE